MSTPQTPADALANLASAPQTETLDGQTVTERPLTDLIEADKHVKGSTALRSRGFGIQRQRISRGDALGGHS